MSSIYTNSVIQNLTRVYSKSDTQAKNPVSSSKNTADFANLLSSIENKKDFSLIPDNARGVKKSPEVLTNIVSHNELYLDKIRNVPLESDPVTIIGDIPIDDEDLKSVKFPISGDNNVTPGKTPGTDITEKRDLNSKELTVHEFTKIDPPVETIKDQTKEINSILDKIQNSFSKKEIKNIITTAGKYHGIDPSLGLAVAHVESSLNPDAISKDGFASKGVFQLLDSTAQDMQSLTGMEEPYQPFDPSMNSFLGIGYLRRLHDIFSKDSQITNSTKTTGAKSASELEKIALAAYNAGEGSVARAQEHAKSLGKDPSLFSSIEPHLPAITRSYVKKVTSLREQFSQIEFQNEQS
jgi:hypothetical protein